jgi:hypothetical protein
MRNKKKFGFVVLCILTVFLSLFLVSCDGEEAPTGEQPAEQPTAAEQPAEQPTAVVAPPAADSVLGTWKDDSGTYTYTADGKLLVNGEDTGQTYTYQDNTLVENYADGTSRTYKVQFYGNKMTETAEDDGSVFALERVDEAPVAAATTAPEQPIVSGNDVDTGFRPEVNGFSVPNYGDTGYIPATGETFPTVSLTSTEMRRMFGDAVCASAPKGDGTCTLTPPASQWMDQNNAGMNGGHCEGFAVLSQMMYGGNIDPNQFGASRAIDLKIPGNEPLQRELAYWWATQGPIWGQQQVLAPKDAVDYLKAEYAKDPKNMYRIGILKEDGTGGHAITAYAVRDQGNGVYWIMVYDNNYPGDERQIAIDTNANTSEYEASINPSVQSEVYRGGPNNPLLLMSNQPRLTTFPCDFCGTGGTSSKGGGILAAAEPKFNEIYTEGYVNVELQDEQGRKVGYDETGKFVNEIADAKVQHVLAGPLTEVPPIINMPVGMDFTAYIWGDDKAAEQPASLVMIGQGFYIGIDDLLMAPGQEDQVAFDGAGDFLTYTTDAPESPDIIVGIEKPQADFELYLKAVETAPGTDIHVLFDQTEDVFAFQTTSDGPAQFIISITRYDANGDEETFDTGDETITIDPDKLMYFYFGKWEGQGSNLEVGYDENGNGEIEDSEITNMADAQ